MKRVVDRSSCRSRLPFVVSAEVSIVVLVFRSSSIIGILSKLESSEIQIRLKMIQVPLSAFSLLFVMLLSWF